MEELWKLHNQQQILLNFHPQTDFATEQEIRDAILRRYYFEELAYKSTWAMTQALQNIADHVQEYYNKLYKTTLLEYDPIEDVDIKEKFHEDATGTGSANSSVQTQNNEFPMGEEAGVSRPVSTSENGSQSYSNTDAKRDNELHRHGLNGRTRSRQELIEQERRIILPILQKYVEEFNDLFMITI